ncbi:Holliday junction branch migration DNA helicase RuvB [Cyanobacterium aponinum]|uniref:Holliday junction branch migration complex subunit RuvB n=1 Tax=Cyanobacterium aponinum 0216 TaxID=2676140 RepID=A0A844GTZ5_9CHRO|nr:Holliday junction branch migration DNA helicase RuvB [Cyanobacterium aponinum]MTF39520.1 Holliday junction branch migration DNA helicase RuvB [Cyanobacterium aponinum 0216]PHV61841.1 Holliday junction branch migration DNA helicase RuvB [Cyanobacterium aponinum IPPAS B-1201]
MAIKRSSSSDKNNQLPKQRQLKKKPSNTPQNEDKEILLPTEIVEDVLESDDKIRPHRFADYIGQKDLKEVMSIAIQATKQRNEPLDHILLYGPPGLGKTTMSLILAGEMGVNCKITAAPALERPRDITGLLVSLKKGDILFIDEIHRLNRVTEELLYPAMEDGRLDITIGKGQGAKIRSIPLAPFTLIGATTKIGSLTSPLRDRFGLIQRLQFYHIDELKEIVLRSAQILNLTIDEQGAIAIASRSRGTPRIANRLLRRVRDYVQVKGEKAINQTLACEALDLHNVDGLGLDWTDRLILTTMIEQFNRGPVGLDAIAAATGEDSKTIEEVYEPYLLQIGFLNRTPRGRVVTDKACEHLNLN